MLSNTNSEQDKRKIVDDFRSVKSSPLTEASSLNITQLDSGNYLVLCVPLLQEINKGLQTKIRVSFIVNCRDPRESKVSALY